MIFVDTNILIDILQGDPVWAARSIQTLVACASRGPLMVNEIVYAELAAGFADRESLDRELEPFVLNWASLGKDALALAGRTFRAYRQNGGHKNNVLADFFIGAQASVEGWAILTRDAARYRTYFPDVTVIMPE